MNILRRRRRRMMQARAGNSRGKTVSAMFEEAMPRLPHESDQSADQQGAAERPDAARTQQAFADVERGLVDTDRGAAYENLYGQQANDSGPGASKPSR